MATFRVSIDTDNAAFGWSRNLELADILRNLAEKIINSDSKEKSHTLVDSNGNTVGKATWS
jgi:hypothetical protein